MTMVKEALDIKDIKTSTEEKRELGLVEKEEIKKEVEELCKVGRREWKEGN